MTAVFDEARAVESAARAIRDRFAEVRDQAEAESTAALAAVEAYARHLAAGGNPSEGFERRDMWSRSRDTLVPIAPALEAVYRIWNEARGSRNPFSPIGGSPRDWEIAEYALERVGEPIVYAEVKDVVSAGRRHETLQSADLAQALAGLQGDDLVLRRTKASGRVAYLLRERRDGEEFVGRRSSDGSKVYVNVAHVPEERWSR